MCRGRPNWFIKSTDGRVFLSYEKYMRDIKLPKGILVERCEAFSDDKHAPPPYNVFDIRKAPGS